MGEACEGGVSKPVWAKCLGEVLGVFQQEFVSVSAMVDKFRPPVQAGFVLVANYVELFQRAK